MPGCGFRTGHRASLSLVQRQGRIALGGSCASDLAQAMKLGEALLFRLAGVDKMARKFGSAGPADSFPCNVDEFVLGLIARATADRLGHLAHEFADGALIATLWLLLCDGKEGPALELAELFRYGRKMSCDCEQKIAELRAEVDGLRDAFVQTLDEMADKCREHLDRIDAKHQMLLATVDECVQRLFARLEAATQDPPTPRPH